MSTFNDYLSKIKSAVYGKDVRGAIHDALSYLNNKLSEGSSAEYKDTDILNFLHIDINKKVVPVPLLGNLFELGTDDENNPTGLEFSTTGRLWLLDFISKVVDLKGLLETKISDVTLDELTSAYSVYYRLSIMDNPVLFSVFDGEADGAFVTAHCIEDTQGIKSVQIAVPVKFNSNSTVPCVATRSKRGDSAWSDWNTPAQAVNNDV